MRERFVSLTLVIIVIIVHTSSIRVVTNSLACDGLVWNNGGYDQAIPAGMSTTFTALHANYTYLMFLYLTVYVDVFRYILNIY